MNLIFSAFFDDAVERSVLWELHVDYYVVLFACFDRISCCCLAFVLPVFVRDGFGLAKVFFCLVVRFLGELGCDLQCCFDLVCFYLSCR